MREIDPFYRRNLPHIQPLNADYFITFRLHGSLPRGAIKNLKEKQLEIEKEISRIKSDTIRKIKSYEARKKYFIKFDDYLDAVNHGPKWLVNEAIASLVADSIKYRDGKVYVLLAYCIMPNHVHLVFFLPDDGDRRDKPSAYIVTDILESLKKFTAIRSNRILKRNGSFWQDESYDHIIRNKREFKNVIRYVLNNPVKAGLVESPEQWKWNWCREDIEL